MAYLFKKNIFLIFVFFGTISTSAQISCPDLIKRVKSESSSRTSYLSLNSSSISNVTFYQYNPKNFKTYYFAIVHLQNSDEEYIYQVASYTEYNYSTGYYNSAGKAFWKYIHPYNKNLKCGILPLKNRTRL